jgi:hypothetical protein
VGSSDIEKVIPGLPGLQVPGVELTSTSLSFASDVPLDKDVWLDVGRRILSAHSAVQWWIGDWLKEGEAFYSGTEGGTIRYTQLDGEVVHYAYKGLDVRSPETEALNLVPGYSRDTLLEFRRVARIFDKPIRIGTLRWGHHQVAAALPTAEARQEALEVADRSKLSVAKFRNYVRRFYPNGTYTPTPDWRPAKDKVPPPTPDSAFCDVLDLVDDLASRLQTDRDAVVFLRMLFDSIELRLLGEIPRRTE